MFLDRRWLSIVVDAMELNHSQIKSFHSNQVTSSRRMSLVMSTTYWYVMFRGARPFYDKENSANVVLSTTQN